jgi:hypothetical protein
LTVSFDDSLEDIIIHDKGNTTWTSFKDSFNGDLLNPAYVLGQVVCAKKTGSQIQIGNCDCKKCVELFDEQLSYSYSKRKLCSALESRGPYCNCFELSNLTVFSEESITFQTHEVCTECKYDSHCQVFNPQSTCKMDVMKLPDGSTQTIGNPL